VKTHLEVFEIMNLITCDSLSKKRRKASWWKLVQQNN